VKVNLVLGILEEHGTGLQALLLRLTLRPDVAEDLMQELFVKLSQSRAFAQAIDPGAYARRMAINLAFDWRRAGRRHTQDLGVDLVFSGRSPGEIVAEAEEVERILEVVEQLGDLARQAFTLRYIEQEGYERVGQILGKTAHQARGLCHMAVQQVRERLAERQVTHERP